MPYYSRKTALGVLGLCLLSFFTPILHADEVHPILLVKASQAAELKARLGSSTINRDDYVSRAMDSYLKNQRDDELIQYVLNGVAANDPKVIHVGRFVYDFQYSFLTPEERAAMRTAFLNDAAAAYALRLEEPSWPFGQRTLNNWLYAGYWNYPLERILYTAILFPEDPRSAEWRAFGMTLVHWIVEVMPGNGIWNPTREAWDVMPTTTDIIDESFFAPNSYGIWGSIALNELFWVVAHSTEFNPFEYNNRVLESDGRYWVYNIGYKEHASVNGEATSLACYAANPGDSSYEPQLANNSHLLFTAYIYGNPVLAWHFYANPMYTGRTTMTDFLGEWNAPRSYYPDWRVFLSWGKVVPRSPVEAGWPLTGYWPNVGAAIIRKSWAKKGPGTGLIWMHAGPSGSHDKPHMGSVIYHADDNEVLTQSPWYGYGRHVYENNTLFVDDKGQVEVQSRNVFGSLSRLGESTFVMNLSPMNRPDYSPLWNLDSPVHWTRKVRYDRRADILWIKDRAWTADKAFHRFRFNWVSEATLRNAQTMDLPGGYIMRAEGNGPVQSEIQVHPMEGIPMATGHGSFKSIYSGVDSADATMWWAIGKNEAALRSYLGQHRGVFIDGVTSSREAGNVTIVWTTDEPSLGRVEYGATAQLGSVQPEVGMPSLTHRVTIPSALSFLYRVVARDGHQDETVDDNGGSLYVALNGPNSSLPSTPANVTGRVETDRSVTLQWSDTSSTETGFQVLRKDDGGDDKVVLEIPANTTVARDTTVPPGHTYSYRVRAINGALSSAESNTVSVAVDMPPLPPGRPWAPANLTGDYQGGRGIVLSWRDNSHDESGFEVWRGVDSTDFKQWMVTNPDVTTVLDSSAMKGHDYYYKVRSFNTYGISQFADALHITVAIEPSGPGFLNSVVKATPLRAQLSWLDTSIVEKGFRVERQVDGGAYAILKTLPENAVGMTDFAVEPGHVYTYRAQAFNEAGPSPYSNTAEADFKTVPTSPFNLSAGIAPNSIVNLNWVNSSVYYNFVRVERSVDGGPFSLLTFLPAPLDSATDPYVRAGHSYSYRIQETNLVGASQYSNIASVEAITSPSTLPPPSTPTGLTAVVGDGPFVALTWANPMPDASFFEIWRRADDVTGSGFVKIGEMPINSTSGADSAVQFGHTYSYRVRAVNGAGPSGDSNVSTILVVDQRPAEPSAPRNLRTQ